MKDCISTKVKPALVERLQSYSNARRWSLSQLVATILEDWELTMDGAKTTEGEKPMSENLAFSLDRIILSALASEKEIRLARALQTVMRHVEEQNPLARRVESILNGTE